MVAKDVEAANAPIGPTGKKKRTMSPEAKERIAATQPARWAKQKAQNAGGTKTAKRGRKAKMGGARVGNN